MNWYTADLHQAHRNIMKYSGRFQFMTEEERNAFSGIARNYNGQYSRDDVKHIPISDASLKNMDDSIIANINSVVHPSDNLYLIGDIGFFKTDSEVEEFVGKLPGRKHLIYGNHDKRKWGLLKCWASVNVTLTIDDEILGRVFMSHFPHLSWDADSYGTYHLFGHCHGTKNNFIDTTMPAARLLDVGVDCHNFMPVNSDMVNRLILNRYAKNHM